MEPEGGDETMRYLFGAYSLDTQCYELRRAGALISLGPQVFNVLAYLVAHRDRVVPRDELFARLWPDQFVTDDALGRTLHLEFHSVFAHTEHPWMTSRTQSQGSTSSAGIIPPGSHAEGML